MSVIITFQKYVRPQSLEEAWELNQKKRHRIVAGMMWLKMGKHSFGTAIDLCDLGLDEIEETENEFRIDAMATLRQMEKHPGLAAYSCGAVEAAFKDIVGVQFRNGATLGGSLWRRMGFSDIVTVFMAMDSYVELFEGGIVPLEEFVGMKYDKDLLVRLIVKKQPGAFAYQAVRKQRTDLPSLNCAAAKLGNEYRVVVGSRPARAMILRDDQAFWPTVSRKKVPRLLLSMLQTPFPCQETCGAAPSIERHWFRFLHAVPLWLWERFSNGNQNQTEWKDDFRRHPGRYAADRFRSRP